MKDTISLRGHQALCLLGWKHPKVFCQMDRANSLGDAEDHVKVLMYGKDLPTVDLEISSCCPFSGDMYQVYGTRGGLAGGPSGLRWRYYRPREAPRQKLIRSPLPGPSYCREELTWHEDNWSPSEEQKDSFRYMSRCYYDHIYKVVRKGAALFITPEQVGVQVAVMEACHRQNKLSRLPSRGWPKGN